MIQDTTLHALLEKMVLIRLFEETIGRHYADQQMKTPVHLCTGQEAVAVGICHALQARDTVTSNHRSHGHYLAKGGDLYALTAELYGKACGCSGGRGGSPHLVDVAHGVMGTSAIVGGGIPIAVGAALSAQVRQENRIAVVFFGDGAADQGTLHESLNFAALKRLPVLFVMENNDFATSSPCDKRHAIQSYETFARSYGMPAATVNGIDVMAIHQWAIESTERARSGGGPSFVECPTLRWEAHVGPERDPGKGYAGDDKLRCWMQSCPIKLLETRMRKRELIDQQAVNKMHRRLTRDIEASFTAAMEADYPSAEKFFSASENCYAMDKITG